ncbi:hypothetical protein [Tropicimonas sediminicola]|uniref:LPS sulfotransferase NodH n=1 Tax=Tropicimonas sediminicola TaxID=1031541 RepID=A0A239L465_9RHOB|nr:hypothetical protein [Tropicimonas sediminicola]SNT24708.1 LPS sulfotransferase NodH [Tropicimonas sediminicola]
MARFDGFVLFAEMRTGSNFLEESLNLFPGLTCHGEAFNPGFVGQHNWPELFGMDLEARKADPLELLRRIREGTEELGGFRFFHDHDPRVLDAVLPDPRIAKVLLSRNPLEAYVSRKIASETGQWRLTNDAHRKVARIRFDAAEFEAVLARQTAFRDRVRRALQVSGQTAFELSYEETGQLDVVNGLAAFLGVTHRLNGLSNRLKRQNPAPLSDKVENFAEMQAALSGMELLAMARGGEGEPKQGASVPTWRACVQAPLLFQPVKGGPTEAVLAWMARLDGVEGPEALASGFNQKTLRQWKNQHKNARGFAIVSHPVARAHGVFERYILATGPGSFAAIRNHLRENDGLPIPEAAPDESYDPADHRAAFLGFLKFLRRNLAGQTRLRTDPAFSTQASLVQSMAEILPPDMVIRDDQLKLGLGQLCQQIGLERMPPPPSLAGFGGARLAQIHDDEIEAAARAAYNRDYMSFGFRGWSQG